LTDLLGSFPKKPFTISWTFGIRVEPPDQHDLLNVFRLQTGVLDGLSTGGISLVKYRLRKLLKLRTG
jgi:hypothetical protein